MKFSGVLICVSMCLGTNASAIRPVSVFPWTAAAYHRYSAVLAATEPYRLQRTEDVKKSLGVAKYILSKIRGSNLNDPADPIRVDNALVNSACEAYEGKAEEIIRAYGLDANTFRNISETVTKHPSLRQQVALQTYYYRIAADLEDNIAPIISSMPLAAPDASPFSVVHRVFGSLPKFSPKTRQDSVTDELAQKFSKGVIAVEEERHRQLRMLESKLGVGKMPPAEFLCNPNTLPLMSTHVQKAYNAFPKQAEKVLRKCGLSVPEFNYLRDTKIKTDKNFREKVDSAVGSIYLSKY